MHWLVLGLAIVLLLFLYEHIQTVDKKWRSRRYYHLPAGPRGFPVVGNLLQFWRVRAGGSMVSYLLSLRNYGEMTTLHMGSQLWVLINTDQAANDVIGKKSSITSDRPHMPVSSGLVSKNKRVVIQRRGAWDMARRMSRQLLTGNSTKAFAEWQDFESVQLLQSYLDEPERWSFHQFRYGTAFLYGTMAGGVLRNVTDEELVEYQVVPQQFLRSLYSSAADFFPILDKLPHKMQLWRPKWMKMGSFHHHVFKKWWDSMKATAERNVDKPSWVRDVALNSDKTDMVSDEEAMYVTNSIVTAGADNTRMSLDTFVTVSARYPREFEACRREIDKICGVKPRRLPGLDDMPLMPYLCAFIKEIMRWRPIVPIVPPHRLTEDLEYQGFIFPKGTNFVINTIAISADCEKPATFQPERWLDGSATRLTKGFWGFGGGRRVCIGYKAEQPALFLAISRLIYCFDFQLDAGHDPKQLSQYTPPESLSMKVSKRSVRHEELIRKEWAARRGCT